MFKVSKAMINSPAPVQGGGTADAITAPLAFDSTILDGTPIYVRATAANSTATPTLALGAFINTIVKGANRPLNAGDISGSGHWMDLRYDNIINKWVLLNPGTGLSGKTVSTAAPSGGVDGDVWYRV